LPTNAATVSTTEPLEGIDRPKKWRSWLTAINTAAPAVKPTITVCDIKLTSAPKRINPSASWMTPAMKVNVSTSATYSGLPGAASPLITLNTTTDTAATGP